MRSTRLLPCEGRNLPPGSIVARKDGGHDDIRFVLRRFTRAERCRRVGPWFVVEVTVADVQVDVHALGPPFLAKCCRLSGKVCEGKAYGLFGFLRADLDELVRVVPFCSSSSSHRTPLLSGKYANAPHPHSPPRGAKATLFFFIP